MPDIVECYLALGLKPGASITAVRAAYKRLVRDWHPDQFAGDPRRHRFAEEYLKGINVAYEQLCSFLSFHRRPFEFVEPPQRAPKTGRRRSHARWGRTESARKVCRPRLRKPWMFEFRFADPSPARSGFRYVLTVLALGGVGLAVLFPLALGLQVLTIVYPQAWLLIYAAAWVLTTATAFASRS